VNWGSGSARMRRFSPLLDVSCAIFANICSATGRSAMGRVEANASSARLNASWRCQRKRRFRRVGEFISGKILRILG